MYPVPNIAHPGQSTQEHLAARIEAQLIELEAELDLRRKEVKDWCHAMRELDPHYRLPLAEFNNQLNILERLADRAKEAVKLLEQQRGLLLSSAAALGASPPKPHILRFVCPAEHSHCNLTELLTCITGEGS